MASSVNKYRIYCTTEEKFIVGYGTDAPTACYTDTAHTVNENSVQLMNTISSQQVYIQEEAGQYRTGGNFGARAFSFSCAANSVTSFVSSFPYPISLLTAQAQVSEENVGDTLDFGMGENTTIGILTQGNSIGATVFTVSSTVITYICIGLEVRLFNGVTSNQCGRCIAVNTVNNTITVETATTDDFTASSPVTYVQVTRYILRNYLMLTPGIHQMGFSKIGAAYVPTNTVGTAIYTNTSDQIKTFCFLVEHLY